MKQINDAINRLEVLTTLAQETLKEIKGRQDQKLEEQSVESNQVSQPVQPEPSNVIPFGKLVTIPTQKSYSLEEKQMITLSSVAIAAQAAVQFLEAVPEVERPSLLVELLGKLKYPGDEMAKQDILRVYEFAEFIELAARKAFNIPDPVIN